MAKKWNKWLGRDRVVGYGGEPGHAVLRGA